MEEDYTDLWKRIDKLRANQSIRELALLAGVNEKSLQKIRVTKTLPKMQILYPIAKALNTTVEYLYTGQEPESEDYDAPLFRRLASDQELMDICNVLVKADRQDLIYVRRALGMPEKKIPGIQWQEVSD